MNATNTRATVLHRDLKLKNQHFHEKMKHPVHGRMVKVFRAQVADFHPLRHADREVYYYKDKGNRYTVDMAMWLRFAMGANLLDNVLGHARRTGGPENQQERCPPSYAPACSPSSILGEGGKQ